MENNGIGFQGFVDPHSSKEIVEAKQQESKKEAEDLQVESLRKVILYSGVAGAIIVPVLATFLYVILLTRQQYYIEDMGLFLFYVLFDFVWPTAFALLSFYLSVIVKTRWERTLTVIKKAIYVLISLNIAEQVLVSHGQGWLWSLFELVWCICVLIKIGNTEKEVFCIKNAITGTSHWITITLLLASKVAMSILGTQLN